LSAVDQKIIGFISGGRVHIDDLISSTGLSSADILSALTTLELKGIVQQYPGKFFSLKNHGYDQLQMTKKLFGGIGPPLEECGLFCN
jgi:hypothetical protein